jgi:MinD superfamily P-loop ATPase
VLVGEPHIFALEDNLRMLDLLRFYDVDVRALVLNKYNLFREDVVRVAEAEYSKLGLKMFRIPWDPELQTTLKPELFRELVGVVV